MCIIIKNDTNNVSFLFAPLIKLTYKLKLHESVTNCKLLHHSIVAY